MLCPYSPMFQQMVLCEQMKEVVNTMGGDSLPLPKRDFIILVNFDPSNFQERNIDKLAYWLCVGGTAYPGECAEGLVWNIDQEACNWPSNTDTSHCLMPGQTTTPVTLTTTIVTKVSTTSETSILSTSEPSTASTSITTSATSTTSTPTTVTKPTLPDCNPTLNYFVPHQSCRKYWWCVGGHAVLGSCSGGRVWDPDSRVCVFADCMTL
ncbi:probable chitinase 10 [Penaeus japonicus]|uniref:probable chitinase 10 n=1 Tax=Penaeus japonicus TaxID=27405 RepID=UPI001C70C884|nr:probable chitinase 10 [Penaeus japonicus]